MIDGIEIGEYIRTYDGIITRVVNLNYYIELYIECKRGMLIQKESIKKHSLCIMDLIEEGDIIVLKDGRKYEVLKISWSKSKEKHIHIINPLRLEGGKDIFIDDIKSIVTKEQFKNIEYTI